MEGELVVFLLFSFPAVWWRVWREENYERSLDQNLEEFFKTKSCPNKQAVQKGGPNEPYAKCEMDCEQKTIVKTKLFLISLTKKVQIWA